MKKEEKKPRYLRLPKDFVFVEGKSYSVKYRRTEWRFTYDPDCELYESRFIKVGKVKDKDIAYVIPKDVPDHMDYVLSFANGKGKITEF